MRKMAFVFATLGAVLGLGRATPCLATNVHSYVSATGVGTACTLAAPCGLISTALAATSDGGEISCLTGDPGAGLFGATIVQSVTIDCPGFTPLGFTINTPGIVVTLRNMNLNGSGLGTAGIFFGNGAALHVENSVIENWTQGAFGEGIHFAPKAGTAKLFVTDSVIKNNGNASSGGGIIIEPATSALADVTIDRTKIENNRHGILAGPDGTIHGVVRDSVVSGNTARGISLRGSRASLLVENTTVMGNSIGLLANASGTMLVSRSSVVLNKTGLSAATGGTLSSYQNNNVSRNTTDGAFTTTIAQE